MGNPENRMIWNREAFMKMCNEDMSRLQLAEAYIILKRAMKRDEDFMRPFHNFTAPIEECC